MSVTEIYCVKLCECLKATITMGKAVNKGKQIGNNLKRSDQSDINYLLSTAVPAIVRDIITIRLVRKAKVQNTRWVGDPNRALITCIKINYQSVYEKRQKAPWSDLEECLGPRCPHLEHDGQDGEDDDLDSGAPRVPVRPTDPVLRRDRLSKRSSKYSLIHFYKSF